jgi:hypothetical protein
VTEGNYSTRSREERVYNRSGTILQENEMVGNQRSLREAARSASTTYPFMLFLQKGLQLADCQPYCSSAEKNWNRMQLYEKPRIARLRDGADFSASFELQL